MEIILQTSGKFTKVNMLNIYYYCKLRGYKNTSLEVKRVMKMHSKVVLIMSNLLFSIESITDLFMYLFGIMD